MTSETDLNSVKMTDGSSRATVIWDHGKFEIEQDLTESEILGFSLNASKSAYIYTPALKVKSGLMKSETEFLKLKEIQVYLEELDFHELKFTPDQLVDRIKFIMRSFQMGPYGMIKYEKDVEFSKILQYNKLCRINVPNRMDDAMRDFYYIAHELQRDDIPGESKFTSSADQIHYFRKQAIAIALNNLYIFDRDSVEDMEEKLRTCSHPERYLSAWCDIYRIHRQEKFLKKWILSKLSVDEKLLFKENMQIDRFLLTLKNIGLRGSFSDFQKELLPLVDGRTIDVLPKSMVDGERIIALHAILAKASEIQATFTKFFNLYDDRTLVSLYQYSTLSKVKQSLRSLIEVVPGLMNDPEIQDLIMDRDCITSVDENDRRLVFYKKLQNHSFKMLQQMRIYDEDRRTQHNDFYNVTPEISLSQVRLGIPQELLIPEDADVFKLFTSKVYTILSGKSAKHGLSEKELDLMVRYKDLPLMIEADQLRQMGKLMPKKSSHKRYGKKSNHKKGPAS